MIVGQALDINIAEAIASQRVNTWIAPGRRQVHSWPWRPSAAESLAARMPKISLLRVALLPDAFQIKDDILTIPRL